MSLKERMENMEKKRFKNAIVKRPSRALVDGITSAPELGIPDYETALAQHDAYIEALKACGVEVTILPADEQYPDSCFVEDPAVVTGEVAIVTNPGAPTRNGEKWAIAEALKAFYPEDRIEYIEAPGTIEGGDVMRAGNHFYVGLSDRTNEEGFRQFVGILEKYGMSGSQVSLEEVLHLKTGASYIEENNLLVSGEFVDKPDFASFNRVVVPPGEAYAANALWVNDTVFVAKDCPETKKAIEELGYPVLVMDTSEYQKIDGSLTCLSLLF